MKEIILTQGKVALVDNADYEWLTRQKWHTLKGHSPFLFYATHSITIQRAGNRVKNKRRSEGMHRVILGLKPGDKRQCDHIDGNGLNNQRSNLRVCTTQQNQQAQRKRKRGTSKYKGVRWERYKWQARIGVNGEQIYLGMFDSESEAARSYDRAALKHFGEFALTNFAASREENVELR